MKIYIFAILLCSLFVISIGAACTGTTFASCNACSNINCSWVSCNSTTEDKSCAKRGVCIGENFPGNFPILRLNLITDTSVTKTQKDQEWVVSEKFLVVFRPHTRDKGSCDKTCDKIIVQSYCEGGTSFFASEQDWWWVSHFFPKNSQKIKNQNRINVCVCRHNFVCSSAATASVHAALPHKNTCYQISSEFEIILMHFDGISVNFHWKSQDKWLWTEIERGTQHRSESRNRNRFYCGCGYPCRTDLLLCCTQTSQWLLWRIKSHLQRASSIFILYDGSEEPKNLWKSRRASTASM